jgi:hypothetical protein
VRKAQSSALSLTAITTCPGQLCREQLQNGHRLRLFLDHVTLTTISE